jgi:DNA primase catalytic subunit
MTKNEIDFIMADKRHIFRDVSVTNRFNERVRLMKSRLRLTLFQTVIGSETFQQNLENRFAVVEKVTSDVNQNLENVLRVRKKVRDFVTCGVRAENQNFQRS